MQVTFGGGENWSEVLFTNPLARCLIPPSPHQNFICSPLHPKSIAMTYFYMRPWVWPPQFLAWTILSAHCCQSCPCQTHRAHWSWRAPSEWISGPLIMYKVPKYLESFPAFPIAMERRPRVLLGLPRHLGTWALFSLLVLPLLPLFLSQVRLHPDRTMCLFPQGLDLVWVTTSDKVLVVRGVTVWGVQQVGTRCPQ